MRWTDLGEQGARQRKALSGTQWRLLLVVFDIREDKECDGGVGVWSMATRWLENSSEVGVLPPRMEKLSAMRVGVGLKM